MSADRILLVSAGWFHPPYRGRVWLRRALEDLPGCSFEAVSSLAAAVRRPLSEYRALVLYYHHKRAVLTEAQLAAFRAFVAAGGGVLAVHSATASYKNSPGYFGVLGGRFSGHGPVTTMEVRPLPQADSIFGGIGAFGLTDELYVHDLQPDIQVHFDALHEGRALPVVWTRSFRAGRVCYVCPGHRSASMRHPSLVEILRRGLRWVCGDDGAAAPS